MKGGPHMLDALWQLLKDNGLDAGEISDGISSLFTVNEDGTYGGVLGSLGDFPLIGTVLQLFSSFTPGVN